MSLLRGATLYFALSSVADASVLHLKEATWDSEVAKSGKGVFVKFFAPWCGHCKALRPTWDKLAETFAGEPSVAIADVDCTEENSLCSTHGVGGYPTLKYFTPENGPKGGDYNGGRDASSLEAFVKKNVMAQCSFQSQEKCGEKEKAYLGKMGAKEKAEQEKELARLTKLAEGSMTADKKAWVLKRKSFLEQMLGKTPVAEKKADDDDDLEDEDL